MFYYFGDRLHILENYNFYENYDLRYYACIIIIFYFYKKIKKNLGTHNTLR